MAELSATIDLDAMRAYRVAVGRRTHEIVKELQPQSLKQKVEPARLGKVWDEGAVVEEARLRYNNVTERAGLTIAPRWPVI